METRRLAILASMIGLALLLSACEEPTMAGEPDPITPVEASQTALVTAPAAVGVTAGIITEQDFTGDGTLDLKADNGILWIQVNRDTISGVKGFVDAGSISGQSNFMNSPLGSDGMVDQVAYWQTVSFTVQILTNAAQMGAYKVTDVEQANGKEVTKEYTLTLEAGREYAEVEYRFTNTGSLAWLYNEYPSHIHDGAHLAVMSARELTDIEAYINGVGVINLPSLRWWASYTPSPTEPFAVVYRPSTGNAMTFGFTAWDYAIHQIVAYYTGASSAIEPHLDLVATAFTLNPGNSARWKALLAFHTGGYARGAQIYSGYSISSYSVSGRVTDGSSNSISGVTISAGAAGSATTNASGRYTITNLITGTYTITPAKSGYTFSPAFRTVSVPPNATGQDFLAIPRPQGGLSVTTDISGQLWIENDFYRIELTNASSFVVKTGVGAREWRIFNPCASGGGGMGILANTQDHQAVGLWKHLYACMSPESVTVLQQTPAVATVRVVVSNTAPVGTVRVASTFMFRADSPAIRVESEVLSSTVSSPVVTLVHSFSLGAGGDTANDWYTWAGGTPTAFPYSGWRTFYASNFTPLTDGYIHMSVYDSAVQQGMALVTKLGDTSDLCTDICYGRATVEGEIYGWKPHFEVNMTASRRTTFYIYPFTVGSGNPIAPVESFINSLVSGFSVSGRVMDNGGIAVPGVSISAGPGLIAATDANGYYTLTSLITGTYTLTPTKSGYTFSPATRTVSVPPDVGGQDFTGTVNAVTWFYEPFSTDVFASGDWTRSDTSVSVDTINGWLHTGADGGVDDYAEKAITFNLPITLETRMRLVSGGANYTLPALHLYYNLGDPAFTLTYGGQGGGWFFDINTVGFSGNHTHGPDLENTWTTVRAVIRQDGGELYAKYDGEADLTFVLSNTFTIPSPFVALRLRQHWDAICDIDYISINYAPGLTNFISGRVTDVSRNPISDVTVSAGLGLNATTNATGYYTITNLITGTYTITPAKSDYTFSPASRTVTLPPDARGQDFVGVGVPFLFEDIGAALTGVYYSSAAWGDYDNDGDLDILLTGWDNSCTPTTKIYRNDGGNVFTDIGAGLAAVAAGSVAWGDYDNDGNLDILLTGRSGTCSQTSDSMVAKVYHNDGNGVFTDINAGLTPVFSSSSNTVAWGDYDNDGDLDILLSGCTGLSGALCTGWVTKIYRNDGNGIFTDINAGLVGAHGGTAAWGDYDNDGDLDILLHGCTANWCATAITKIYRNDGGGVFTDINVGLPAIEGSAAWGDYDNDGDLDILLAGSYQAARVYRNDGNDVFTDIGAALTPIQYSSAAWGDYDNDGDLDILLTGWDNSLAPLAKIYRNDGNGVFTDIGDMLTGVAFSSVAWGDYDNDGHLDILLTGDTGSGHIAKIYRNNTTTANTVPSAPSGLMAATTGTNVTLNWNSANDSQTVSRTLTYNLRVGTTPGGSQVIAPMADTATGYRRVPQMGNANHGLTATLNLPPGAYYWSVQAIDTAFAGSPFASESSFTISGVTIVPPTDLHARPGPTSITLDWTPSTSANLVGYNVYRSTAPITGFVKVNSALVTGDTWADTGPGLITGTLYYYYLTALDRYNQESAPSATVSATYGQVQLSIPTLQGPHGVTVTVPINIANATGLSIDAMDVYVVYTPTTLSALEVRRTILSLGYGFALNIVQPGVVRIALASGVGGSPLRGSGTLFQVVFNVPGNTGDTSKLDFDVAQTDLYGNGDLYHPLPLSLVNGAFTVAPGYVLGDLNGDGVVNSADAALALQIAVGLITPTPQQRVAGDVNSDGRINAADAALIMRMAAGLPVLPSGASAAAGTVELSIPQVTGAVGQRVSVPINISNAANVAGADLIINYDPTLLTAQGAQVSDLTAHFDLQVNTSPPGVLRLSLKPKAGYEGGLEGGAGTLATLEFTIQDAAQAGDVSPLTLAMGRLNDSYSRDFATSALQTPVNLVSGRIQISPNYIYMPLILR